MSEQLTAFKNILISFIGDNFWVAQVFIIVLLTLVIHVFSKRSLEKMESRFTLTKNIWDDTFIIAAKKPLGLFIWIIGLLWAIDIVYQVSGEPIFSFVKAAQEVAVIFFLSWFLFRATQEIENRLKDPERMAKPVDQTTALALGKLVRASIAITGSLVVLQTLGFSISGVLAFGGIGGIAVGFAARDILANFFGGLMIFLDRPFKVGDWILSPDKSIEGTVEHIGWRLTVIRKFDKRPLYVPNAVFSNVAVENPSRMTHRRIYETIGVRYADIGKLADIIRQIKHMLTAHEEIDSTQTMIVNLNQFGPSSVDFFIYTFTKTTNWIEYHEVKQDVLFKVIELIEASGAEVAFPTQTIHIEQPDIMNAGV